MTGYPRRNMDLTEMALYGIAVGIASALPVSADGIASAVGHFLSIDIPADGTAAAIACIGALAAIAVRYLKKVFSALKGTAVMLYRAWGKGFSYADDSTEDQRDVLMFILSLVPCCLIPAVGREITSVSRDQDIIVEGICFLLSGALLMSASRSPRGESGDGTMKPWHALLIGIASVAGIFAGVSGFAAALSAALLLGYEASYSLRSALFTSAAAGIFAAFCGAGRITPAAIPDDWTGAAVCFAAAAAVCFCASLLTAWLLKKEKTAVFAYLMMILGLIIVILGTVETVSGMPLAELIAAMKG